MISYESLSVLVQELQDLANSLKGPQPMPPDLYLDRESFNRDCGRCAGLRFAGKGIQEALDRLFE